MSTLLPDSVVLGQSSLRVVASEVLHYTDDLRGEPAPPFEDVLLSSVVVVSDAHKPRYTVRLSLQGVVPLFTASTLTPGEPFKGRSFFTLTMSTVFEGWRYNKPYPQGPMKGKDLTPALTVAVGFARAELAARMRGTAWASYFLPIIDPGDLAAAIRFEADTPPDGGPNWPDPPQGYADVAIDPKDDLV